MIKKLFFLLLIVHVTIVRSKDRETIKENDDDAIYVDGPNKKSDTPDVVSSKDYDASGANPAQTSDDESDEDMDNDEDSDNNEYANDDKGSAEGDDRFEYSGNTEKPCFDSNKGHKESNKKSTHTFACDEDGFFKPVQVDEFGATYCTNKAGEKTDCEITEPPRTITEKAKVDILVVSPSSPKVSSAPSSALRSSFLGHPGLLAAIIGGAVVGLLCAVLLVMFLVYRMKKKDEGSYALDEPSKRGRSPAHMGYQKAPSKEYYA